MTGVQTCALPICVACRRRARGGERARRTFTRPGTAVTTPATASVMLGRLGEYKTLREWYTTYVASTQQDLKRSGRKEGRGAELGSQGEVIGARRVCGDLNCQHKTQLPQSHCRCITWSPRKTGRGAARSRREEDLRIPSNESPRPLSVSIKTPWSA